MIKINNYGVTVLESLLAITIFSMLSGVMFYIFSVSAGSWLKVRQTVEVKESAQVVLSRIERELRCTSPDSIQLMNHTISSVPLPDDVISFLSAFNSTTGKTEYDSSGHMAWQKYVIFYLEDDKKYKKDGYYQLWSREVSLADYKGNYPSQQIQYMPYPHLISPPGTAQSLLAYITMAEDSYTTKPRPVDRNITYLNFTLDNTGLQGKVYIHIKTGKPVKPESASSEDSPEKLDIKACIGLRNK